MKGINNKQLNALVEELEDIKTRLEEVKNEAEVYYEEKSEKWQEGDNGQLMDEKIGEMDVGIEDLEALIEKLNDIAGD